MWCGLWFDLIEMGGCLVCWLECLIPGALMVGVVVVVVLVCLGCWLLGLVCI